MLNFYDFEVFKYDWLVVIANPIEKTEKVIVNDKKALEEYYNAHSAQIFVGYNSRNYDQYIMKAILCGFNPKEMNDYIIVKKQRGYTFSRLLNKFPLNNYDVFKYATDHGLKTHEGFMGNNIKETSVPFDIDRKLTKAELDEVIKYCTHDVSQTMEVFMHRKSEFDAKFELIKMFKLPLSYIGKTDAQLTAIILGARKQERDDEFDFELPETLQVKKYQYVVDWFKSAKADCTKEMKEKYAAAKREYDVETSMLHRHKLRATMEKYDWTNKEAWSKYFYDRSLETTIAGVPHTFGWGGIHGAKLKYSDSGFFVNMDVNSYYPSLMICYNWLSRNVSDPTKFKEIYDNRIAYKAAKDPRQAPLKLILNTTFGASKDKFNQLYDPRQANNICVGGQLLLLDLIEKIEPYCDVVQSNTDGILVKIDNQNNIDIIDDIVYDFEQRTGMTFGFDVYRKVFQKDVNNYVIVDKHGHYKSKGAYVKKLSELDNDLPIINTAMIELMLHGTPPEVTINKCDDLKQFQKIVHLSDKYGISLHNGKKLSDKTFRVFASVDIDDGAIYKQKQGKNPEKYANTSEHCFIDNGDVNNKSIPELLDRQWYIDLAKKRLAQFGIL